MSKKKYMQALLSILIVVGTLIFPAYGLTDDVWSTLINGTKQSLQRIITTHKETSPAGYSQSDALKIVGIAWHNIGLLGEVGAGDKAFKSLEKAYKLSPSDAEVLAYMGSAETLRARDDWFPITKIMGVNSGTAKIDDAVRKAPNNNIIRLVRANNSLALPSFFNRTHFAKEDLLYLETSYQKKELQINNDTMSFVYLTLGNIYRKESGSLNKAVNYFKLSIQAAPDSSYAKDASEMVKILSD